MKKYLLSVIMVIIMGLSVIACGKKDDADNDVKTTESVSSGDNGQAGISENASSDSSSVGKGDSNSGDITDKNDGTNNADHDSTLVENGKNDGADVSGNDDSGEAEEKSEGAIIKERLIAMMKRFGEMGDMSEEEQKAMLARIESMNEDQLVALLEQFGDFGMSGAGGDKLEGLAGMMQYEGMKVEALNLPSASTEFSKELATNALVLCTGHSKKSEAKLFTDMGFMVLSQTNYEKSNSDPSHTCAYTVAKGTANIGGKDEELIVIAIRGTNSGEWYSNFNFSNSRSDDTLYADNFFDAASVISLELLPTLMENPKTKILVCGHSRGAAVGSLLTMLLNDTRGKENVYCYTFASPTTYRGEEPKSNCENIYNIINPLDVIPRLPIAGWGFKRVGNDIILPGDPVEVAELDATIDGLTVAAPTISSYYNDRHAMLSPGSDENGMTVYELMLALASTLIGQSTEENGYRTLVDVYGILAKVPEAAATSDLAPVYNFMQNFIGMDGTYGMAVFAQHMPSTYHMLMEAMFSAE